MRKIKTYISNLPIGVKWIVGINLLVYLMSIIVGIFFNIRLQDYLGAYPTYSNNFNPLQLITHLFTHTFEVYHILSNMVLLLIFSPFVEKKFGTKFFVLTYLVCGILGYMFSNYAYHQNKPFIENIITSSGVKINDIKVKNFKIDDDYLSTLNVDENNVVRLYHNVINKLVGASSTISGIIVIFFFFNIRELKRQASTILAIILSIILGYTIIMNITQQNDILDISDYAHFGGFVGGLIISVYYNTKNGNI
jgi:membrane associated rhomboid family serine protease